MERTTQRLTPNPDSPARILVIHGSPERRHELANCLAKATFRVTEAGSGREAVDIALAERPDLVLVDMHLPDMDGAEVASKLRSAGLISTSIVAMGRQKPERGVALSAGCDGAVDSPPDLAKLPTDLRAYLGGKRERLRTGEEKKYLKEFSHTLVDKLDEKLRELTVANERLQQSDRFKNEFMAAISHELSTPLTPIVGYLKLLHTTKLGTLDERQTKAVEAMLHSAYRLARTIENLADFAVLQGVDYRIRAAPLELRPLAQKVLDELLDAAKRKRVNVALAAPEAMPPLVGDGHRLEQALGNLVDNAIRFSPHGGQVLVQLEPGPAHVRLAVLDQGPGVPPARQEQIFEPVSGVKQGATPSAIVSMGLGLPVTRKIVEAHGGRIWVESPPATQPAGPVVYTGARFVMEIPARTAQG